MIPSMKMLREAQYEYLADEKPHKLSEVVEYFSNLYNLSEEEKKTVNTGSVESKIKFRIRRNYEYLMKHGFVIRSAPATFQATDFIDKWIESGKHELDNGYAAKFKYYYPKLMKKIRVIEKIVSTNSCKNTDNKVIEDCNANKNEFLNFLIDAIIDYDVPDNRIRELIEYALNLNYNINNERDIVPLI